MKKPIKQLSLKRETVKSLRTHAGIRTGLAASMANTGSDPLTSNGLQSKGFTNGAGGNGSVPAPDGDGDPSIRTNPHIFNTGLSG